jgi:hypothetical protein
MQFIQKEKLNLENRLVYSFQSTVYSSECAGYIISFESQEFETENYKLKISNL